MDQMFSEFQNFCLYISNVHSLVIAYVITTVSIYLFIYLF